MITADETSGQRPGSSRPLAPDAAMPGGIVVFGAHGGAGTSTLAVLLRPAWDMGAVRGTIPYRLLRQVSGQSAVLVTRNSAPAAGHAVEAAGVLRDGGVAVAALAVVSDGLPEPAEAAYRFRVLSGLVGAVVRLPFIPSLRVAADPLDVRLPRRARSALDELRLLAGSPVTQP